MQSGILYGYVGQVEGIVKRMKEEAKQEPKVIATGGLAKLISEESNVIDVVDPFLTLKVCICYTSVMQIYSMRKVNK